MPRQNDNTELIRRLVSIEMLLPQTGTIFDQTTAGSTARGGSTITVPATTNATNGDNLIIIGANGSEHNQINGAPVVAMPLKWKTEFLHPAGTRVLEAQPLIALGRIEQNAFTFSPSQAETIIEAADQDTPVQTIRGTLELGWSFALLGFNAHNLLNATGYDIGATGFTEQGTGTAADPYQASLGAVGQATLGIVAFKLTLLRFDSKTVTLDFMNCSVVPTGQIQMGAKNAPASIGFSGKCSQVVKRMWS